MENTLFMFRGAWFTNKSSTNEGDAVARSATTIVNILLALTSYARFMGLFCLAITKFSVPERSAAIHQKINDCAKT